MKTIAFFNNKGGVGKTSLVFHLSCMYAELGLNVVAADLDPQANLTTMFLDEDRLEALWAATPESRTVLGAILPLMELPAGSMAPLGYIVMQHAVGLDRPVQACEKWMSRIPSTYRQAVLGEQSTKMPSGTDPHCLATLKHYRSLMAPAQEARKPMFVLLPADGAIGGDATARSCYRDYAELSREIARRAGVAVG